MKLNQKGIAPVLILVAIVGIVAFFAVASSAPVRNNFLASLFPKKESQAATAWAFEENFDDEGVPTAPKPYVDPQKFQFVVTSNDSDGILDGQTVDSSETVISPTPPYDMGHGPNCEPPIGNADPNMNVHSFNINNVTETQFQSQIRPNLIFICNQHMMTSAKSGYGIISFMPRQYFDYANRTGTIEFDNNVYGFGREWFDVYLIPEQDMLHSMAILSEGGTLEQHPRTAVKFSYKDATPQMYFIENYNNDDSQTRFWRSGYKFSNAFPNDPASTDPKTRRTFRFQISQNSWKYQVQVDPTKVGSTPPTGTFEVVDGKTFWTFSGNFPKTVPFTKVLTRFEHHTYNPTKDGIFGKPWSQFTYHWDNIRFDGPVLPAHTAFLPTTLNFIKMWGAQVGTISPPMRFNLNVAASDIKNARMIGELVSSLNRGEVDLTNSSHWRQFRVNGGSWQDVSLVKNVDCGCDRTWSTFRNNLTGLVPGDNTIEFRYSTQPPGKTWQPDGFNIKDVEIQIDPVGVILPSTTPFPTPTPLPSPSPSPSPTPLPSGLIAVDFNSRATGVLTGEYPTGVINWGTSWIVSAPFGQFTTNSASFSSQSVTQSTFSIVPANRTLTSLQAFNGGSAASTVTISCAGNATKTQSVAANSLITIPTGWTAACATVTVSSSNGWNTNFDNIEISPASGTPNPSPSVAPSPVVSPSLVPSPSPVASVKPGDVDGNGRVDIFDYNSVVTAFGQTGANLQADLDKNGRVDIFDYNLIVTNFGK